MPATTLTDRSVIRLSGGAAKDSVERSSADGGGGEDVRGFLQGLVTSDVAGDLPVWTGLLTPQGKTLFDFLVWADGEDLLIDCETASADAVIKRLSMYRLRRAIVIGRDEALAVHWAIDGDQGVPDPRLAALGRRWLGARSTLPPSPEHAWRAHRLSLGVTEGAAELGDLLWLECNAAELNGVSFTKGCFVGQENTARMNWRQKVNRRLFVVSGNGGDRERAAYPELGLTVVHARVDNIPANAILPEWLSPALS